MKLKIKLPSASPRMEKITLDAETVELFDPYLQFYQQITRAKLTVEQAIIQMLQGFIKSDRDFMRWYRQTEDKDNHKINEVSS